VIHIEADDSQAGASKLDGKRQSHVTEAYHAYYGATLNYLAQ
jgi:hypothetical protein